MISYDPQYPPQFNTCLNTSRYLIIGYWSFNGIFISLFIIFVFWRSKQKSVAEVLDFDIKGYQGSTYSYKRLTRRRDSLSFSPTQT